jgi:hypothetical protein
MIVSIRKADNIVQYVQPIVWHFSVIKRVQMTVLPYVLSWMNVGPQTTDRFLENLIFDIL